MIKIKTSEVKPGDKLARTLYYQYGAPILTAGTRLTQRWIDKLKTLGFQTLYLYDQDLEDVLVYDFLDQEVQRRLARKALKLFDEIKEETRGVIDAHMLKNTSAEELRQKLSTPEIQKAVSRLKIGEKFIGDVETIVATLLSDQEVCLSVGVIKTVSSFVFDHSLEVAIRSLLIARKVGFTNREMHELALGCLLHDIGYVLMPEDILRKKGKHTAAEENMIKQHTVIGYHLLRQERSVSILAAHVAYQHHERQDGGGYPRGLAGTNSLERRGSVGFDHMGQIHRYAAVAAVADFYDTLVSEGPLGRGVPPDTAVKVLRDVSGKFLNPLAVEAYLSVIPVFPVGTTVLVMDSELKGHRGVVVSVSRSDLDLPTVRITMLGRKRLEKSFDVDLRQQAMTIKTVGR
jgi:putative nucleotidyltransferase with HDIG domain